MKKYLFFSLAFLFLASGCSTFNSAIEVKESNKESIETFNNDPEPLVFDVWDGTTASSFSSGDGSSGSPYVINSAKELAYFRSSLASKSYYQNKYLVLQVNVDLNNLSWLGIGGGTSGNSFKGNLDGNNHIIKNINMSVTGERKGFFNSNSGTISNLSVEGSLSGGNDGNVCYGLLAGINYGNITNCSSKGDVDVIGNYVAGFIGCNAGGDLTNCSYLGGTTFGTNCVGGIIGYNMVSSNKIGSLYTCKNYGTITAKDYPDQNYSGLGGIIGTCGSGASVNNCVNYGDVIGSGRAVGGTGGIIGNNFNTSITGSTNEGLVVGSEKVAGIVGHARNAVLISNCINKGHICGDIAVAGISGYNRANIEGCENQGEIEADIRRNSYWIGGIAGMLGSNLTVSQCVNKGFVHGLGSSSGGVGGIVGSNYASTISQCTNQGLVQGLYRVGGVLGYSQTTTGYVLSCVNEGDFKSIAKFGTISLGGIVGYNQAAVIGCTNSGHYIIEDDISIEMYGYIIGYDLAGDTKVYKNVNNA